MASTKPQGCTTATQLDRLLGILEARRNIDFVIACGVADWCSASGAATIKRWTGVGPVELTLEPLGAAAILPVLQSRNGLCLNIATSCGVLRIVMAAQEAGGAFLPYQFRRYSEFCDGDRGVETCSWMFRSPPEREKSLEAEIFEKPSLISPTTPAVAQLRPSPSYKIWLAWRTTKMIESSMALFGTLDAKRPNLSILADVVYLRLSIEESQREFAKWPRETKADRPSTRLYEIGS